MNSVDPRQEQPPADGSLAPTEELGAVSAKTLGHFELIRLLGAGGMGEVWLARDRKLDRLTAVKLLPAECSSNPERKIRFLREARAVARLTHPNIAAIYEVGEADGTLFFAMEFVEGETLSRWSSHTPRGLTELTRVAIEIVEALGESHRQGVIHRDIKPGNVMISVGGRVKLLDFGIACLQPTAERDGDAVQVTRTGIVMGTASYMSPEQANGHRPDQRSDLYSFGVVLYQLSTGRLPHAGDSFPALLQAIAFEPPRPITAADREAARQLEPILVKCLAKDPASRYQSAGELRQDLQRLQTGSYVPATRPGRRLLRAGAALFAIGLALAAVSVVVFEPEWSGNPLQKSDPRAADPLAAGLAHTSVAVLPFANAASAAEDYLSDGFADEIIGLLARSRNLKVVSRTSSFAFRNAQGDVREIGRQLGVSTVVEGSVRVVADRIRVQAQLVNVDDGYNLWSSGVHERSLDDVLTLQEEIGRGIAAALKAELPAHGTRQAGENSPDPEAYQLYLRGRYHLNTYHRKELPKAIEALRLAVAKQPDFSVAHAALADAYAFMDHFELLVPAEAYRLATESARRAIEIDPDAGEAWAALGHVQIHEGKFEQAGEALRRAIAISPSSSIAGQWHALLLLVTGRPGWREEFERSIELDPFSTQTLVIYARRLQDAGDYGAAISYNERSIRLDPMQSHVHQQLARSQALAGNAAAAHASIVQAQALALEPNERTNVDLEAAFVSAMADDRATALELLGRHVETVAPDGAAMPILMVRAFAALGEVDEAIAWSKKMVDHNPWYARVNLFLPPHPAFDPVRRDPRWQRQRNMLGLPTEQFAALRP
jgi:eukaryotic-like serine/threonine-protein kinase